MTAEVAIINRSGIAVAADSAATIGRRRVWKSANKLFSMGPNHDMGIMFFGAGDLFGCHWEIIIKQFREDIVNKNFDTVKELAIKFQEFFSQSHWFDERALKIANAHLIALCIEKINSDLEYQGALEFRQQVKDICEEKISEIADNQIILPKIKKSDFLDKNRDIIKSFCEEIFKQKIVKSVLNPIESFVFEYFRRANCVSDFETGIVIFGYGKNEKFPAIYQIVVDGSCCEQIRCWDERSINLNKSSSRGGLIPFAQTDMASLFMEGISSIYLKFFSLSVRGFLSAKDDSFIRDYVAEPSRMVEKALRDRENEKILKEMGLAFDALRQTELIQPVVESIHSLPRDEMAAMAEAFIEITSMRRKVDSHLETVGGAVDVAIISKGEGFVWIKRKTYFDADINPDYIIRRRSKLSKGTAE